MAQTGDIVSRRKGLVMHRGVVLRDGRVLHNTPFKGEHISTLDEFSAGRRVYTQPVGAAARRRASGYEPHVQRRSYHLLRNNCEHTVHRAVHGSAKSPQLRGWVLGAGLAAAAFALTRHPAVAAGAYALGRKLGQR